MVSEQDAVVRNEVFDSIAQELTEITQSGELASVSVGVLHQGQLSWMESFGLADIENNIPASPDTSYPVASVGKAITSLAILRLAEQSKISLDVTLDKLVNPDRLGLNLADRYPTVRELLSMTGGVPHAALTYDDGNQPQPKQVLQNYGNVVMTPGKTFHYSNMSVAMLEPILEKYYPSVAQGLSELVFTPLEMKSASCTLESSTTSRYDAEASVIAPFVPYPVTSRHCTMSVRDLLKLAAAMISNKADNPISGWVQKLVQTPSPEFPKRHVSLGWAAIPLSESVLWLATSGNDSGAQASITILPNSKTAVVVLANSSGYQADEIAIKIANKLVLDFQDQALAFMRQFQASQSAAIPVEINGAWAGNLHRPNAELPAVMNCDQKFKCKLKISRFESAPFTLAKKENGMISAMVNINHSLWQGHQHHHDLQLSLDFTGNRATGFIFTTTENNGNRLEAGQPLELVELQ